MNKTIRVSIFDPSTVNSAVRELREYRQRVERKAKELRARVAELIREQAQTAFYYAIADDLVDEEAVVGGVDVTVSDNGNFTLIIARGEDAVFMEFGAGVYHNGSVGSSPHPLGGELGFTIGGYGFGNGKKEVWGFRGSDGEIHLTHGAPASMPLYNAVQSVSKDIARIAREVFST